MKKLNVNPQDLNAALVQAHTALNAASQTVDAISKIASSIDVKRIERALEFVEHFRQVVLPHTVQDESRGFALDRSTRNEIRYRHSIGVSVSRLAEDFGIGRTTVRRYLSHNR